MLELQIIALLFLLGAIILGFLKKINVGLVSFGLALILALIGKVESHIIFAGFPNSLFITLLGTMFYFSLLQSNNTIELLSKKMVMLVGKQIFMIPIIIYVVSFALSAAGPGVISVQSVMIVFAVSLAIQMKCSPVLLGAMAIWGAAGGTTSPIALTGIIVRNLTSEFGIENVAIKVFLASTLINFICAFAVYIIFKGYKLKSKDLISSSDLPKFDVRQKKSIVTILLMAILVIGFRYDVGLVSFSLGLILLLLKAGDEKYALKMIPWNVLILICGVNVLMNITQQLGGIQLLSNILATVMHERTAVPLLAFTSGVMSWFSSANGVVMPTLIPAVPDIVSNVGGNLDIIEMIKAVVLGSNIAVTSPLSTGGSLALGTYIQKAEITEKEQQQIFRKLFVLSFGGVVAVAIFSLIGGFKIFL